MQLGTYSWKFMIQHLYSKSFKSYKISLFYSSYLMKHCHLLITYFCIRNVHFLALFLHIFLNFCISLHGSLQGLKLLLFSIWYTWSYGKSNVKGLKLYCFAYCICSNHIFLSVLIWQWNQALICSNMTRKTIHLEVHNHLI